MAKGAPIGDPGGPPVNLGVVGLKSGESENEGGVRGRDYQELEVLTVVAEEKRED